MAYDVPDLLHRLGISRARFAAAAAVHEPGPLLHVQAQRLTDERAAEAVEPAR